MKINPVLEYYYRAYNQAAQDKEVGRYPINIFKRILRADHHHLFYEKVKKIVFNIFCGRFYWPNTFPTAVDQSAAALLYSLVRVNRPEIALEIGTAKGNSAIAIAQAMEDNGRGRLYTIDPHEEELTKIAIKKSGLSHRIEYLIGYSKEVIPRLRLERLDFVFIDGDHIYENVLTDFNLVKDLLGGDGLLVFHDTLLFDGPRRIIEEIDQSGNFSTVTLATAMGLDKSGRPMLATDRRRSFRPVGITICRKKPGEILLIHCPVCDFNNNLIPEESHRDFTLYRCDNCQANFWWPLAYPGKTFYEESYMFLIANKRPPAWYHRQFLKNPPCRSGLLLDVGCGQGEFLGAAAASFGFDVWGIDIAAKNVDFVKKTHSLEKVYCEPLEDFMQRKDLPRFDVITVFEVMEHLTDPVAFLNNLRQLLKPGGHLVLSFPNRDRCGKKKEDWDYPPNHFYRWNSQSISRFLESRGLTMVKIIEQPFSPDFFFNNRLLSLGIMNRLRNKLGGSNTERGGVVRYRAPKLNFIYKSLKAGATIKNMILTPLVWFLAGILQLFGYKYWDLYVTAQSRHEN